MDNLFLLLFFASIIALVVGLIKPIAFTRFLKEQATRKGVATFFGITTIVFFILFAVTTDTNTSPAEERTDQTAQQDEQEIKGPFSVLEVSDVSVAGTKVSISGKTDLPTGSSLIIGFDVWGRGDADLYIGVDGETTVSNGAFNISLDIPQRDEFKISPYEVSVSFTPRGQKDSVIALVGKDGENLEGELVDEAFGSFNTIKLVEKVDLQLSVSAPSFTFQLPSEFPQGSPERALAEYAVAWRDQNWQKMVNFAQKTWASVQSDPAGRLEAWYDFKTLKGFEIKNINKVNEVTTDITFVVHYEALTNQIDKKEITARVMKETAPYTPSPQGQWGVNPTSTLRQNDID